MTQPTIALLTELRRRVFLALEDARGRSFEPYLWEPFLEAVQERMGALQVVKVEEYLHFLENDAGEAFRLEEEALIGVTSFFRDPQALQAVKNRIISRILPLKSPGDTVRLWVAGCSTGQEAYSLTMLMHEVIEESGRDLTLRVVATDINARAIAHARAGVYRSGQSQALPAHLRNRFFSRVDDKFVAHQTFRKNLLFCVHDILEPPPFDGLDFVSCRNVLIYFHGPYQTRILSSLKESLHPSGLLFLGSSEGAASNSDSFALLDPQHKIFIRRSPGSFL